MEVYKFGGASIETSERMRHLLPIIGSVQDNLIIVASAIGKTTNALEEIAKAAYNNRKAEAHQLAENLFFNHIKYSEELELTALSKATLNKLNQHYTELLWAIDDAPLQNYDCAYDQIVSAGELMSTAIFSAFLNEQGLLNECVDIRDIIRTDDTFRDARVDINYSQKAAQTVLAPILKEKRIVVTQGFIGSNAENATTTLGREGSDYTAALLASWMGAKNLTIWKDVEGLQNADPKLFPHTVRIEAITYHEVIEMAYYGAQVIHPKTIKPLQNAGIPLLVRCFLNPAIKGTVIKNEAVNIYYPPLIIAKDNQVLLQVTTRDFSFITEENLSKLYNIFASLKIKINLIQNAAISFVACVDQNQEKILELTNLLEQDYQLLRNEGVSLLTIRHYTPEILFDLTKGKYIMLEQKTQRTVQVIIKG